MHISNSMAVIMMFCITSGYLFAGKPSKVTGGVILSATSNFHMEKNILSLKPRLISKSKNKKIHPKKITQKTVFFDERVECPRGCVFCLIRSRLAANTFPRS